MEGNNLQGSLFGYSRGEVNKRLSEMEDLLETKQLRISQLREENERLRLELETFHAREKEVAQALIEAHARADVILQEAHAQAEDELKRSHQMLRQLEAMASNRKAALEELVHQAEGYAKDFREMLEEQNHTLELLETPVPSLERLMVKKSA